MIVAAFSYNMFSGEMSLSLKKSYLLTFLDDRGEALAVCLSKSYSTLIYFVINCFNFLIDMLSRYNKFLNLNGLSDHKYLLFTKNEYGSRLFEKSHEIFKINT